MIDVKAMVEEAQERVSNFEVEYKLQHGTNLDFGGCGYGVPVIAFGRKRKVREYLENNGVSLSSWYSGGRKAFSIKLPIKQSIHVQNYDFNTRLSAIITEVIEKYCGNKVESVYNHTWVD